MGGSWFKPLEWGVGWGGGVMSARLILSLVCVGILFSYSLFPGGGDAADS